MKGVENNWGGVAPISCDYKDKGCEDYPKRCSGCDNNKFPTEKKTWFTPRKPKTKPDSPV